LKLIKAIGSINDNKICAFSACPKNSGTPFPAVLRELYVPDINKAQQIGQIWLWAKGP